MPERIQQRRVKGWRKPGNTVSVARPGKFGNPFMAEDGLSTGAREVLVADFRAWLLWRQSATHSDRRDERKPWKLTIEQSDARRARILDALPSLRGKNLMCFCPLDQPCHADVLLELANPSPTPKETR